LPGGIGFGRIRISLLFRSIETRLPPNQLGWDVGTFEFTSDRILAVGYNQNAKLKLRTGGSVGKIGRSNCKKLEGGDGVYWDIETKDDQDQGVRLPVKYRYRSPVVFEFHTAGKRKADAYSVIWLHHLIDNEQTPINIPIWQTSAPARLCQNYITEANCKDEVGLDDLKEVGRLQFRCRFKAGMDESHEQFIQDNDSRETFETWQACLAEGVRQHKVDKEVPELIQQLHEESLTEGRDVLRDASEEEKTKWLAKDGKDWSGAFGHDPKAYLDTRGRKRREPGVDEPLHDPHHPSDDEANEEDEDSSIDSSDVDLGIQDATNNGDTSRMSGQAERDGPQSPTSPKSTKSSDPRASMTSNDTTLRSTNTMSSTSSKEANKQNKKTEQRKQRGLMQWKPARNAKFAKDQGKLGIRKLKNKITGGLDGRQPGVETGEFATFVYLPLWDHG
jgi:hypothetical protein